VRRGWRRPSRQLGPANSPAEPGIRADVEDLVPIVEAGLDALDGDGDSDETADEGDGEDGPSVRNRLVEYNVHEQVAIARETEEAADAEVYGFVYDFHGAYGGRTARSTS